jgi:hypothetical protein
MGMEIILRPGIQQDVLTKIYLWYNLTYVVVYVKLVANFGIESSHWIELMHAMVKTFCIYCPMIGVVLAITLAFL